MIGTMMASSAPRTIELPIVSKGLQKWYIQNRFRQSSRGITVS